MASKLHGHFIDDWYVFAYDDQNRQYYINTEFWWSTWNVDSDNEDDILVRARRTDAREYTPVD